MAWPPKSPPTAQGWVYTNDPDRPEQRVVHLPQRRAIWFLTLDLFYTARRSGPVAYVWLVRLDAEATPEAYTIDVRQNPLGAVEPDVLHASRLLRWSELVRFRGTGWFYVVADNYDVTLGDGGRPAQVTVAWHNKRAQQFGVWFKAVAALPQELVQRRDVFPASRTIWLEPQTTGTASGTAVA